MSLVLCSLFLASEWGLLRSIASDILRLSDLCYGGDLVVKRENLQLRRRRPAHRHHLDVEGRG